MIQVARGEVYDNNGTSVENIQKIDLTEADAVGPTHQEIIDEILEKSKEENKDAVKFEDTKYYRRHVL